MSTTAQVVAAVLGVVLRDAALFLSYRGRFLSQTLAVLFSVALFYYLSRLIRTPVFPTPGAYFAYVVAGLVTVELLTGTLAAMPQAVRAELLAGTFERLAVSPLGPRAAVLAMCIFPVILAAAIAGVTVLVAALVFGLDVRMRTLPLVVPAAILCTLAFLPLSLLVASTVLLFKQAGSAATFLVTGLALTSGAFFPRALLPSYLGWVAQVQPLTPALGLMRELIVGIEAPVPLGYEVLRLAVFATVMLPVSFVVLERVVRRCRRQGTLTEY